MPSPTAPERLSPLRVLRLSWALFRQDREVFLLTALLLAALPAILGNWLMLRAPESGLAMWLPLPLALPPMILQMFLIKEAVIRAEGRPAPVLRNLWDAVLLQPSFWLMMVMQAVPVGLGLLLLIVPGLMLTCLWAASMPVLAVETAWPWRAMRRSGALAKGQLWRIFLTGLLFTGIMLAAFIPIFLVFGIPRQEPRLLFLLLDGLANAGVGIVSALGLAALYLELRRLEASRVASP